MKQKKQMHTQRQAGRWLLAAAVVLVLLAGGFFWLRKETARAAFPLLEELSALQADRTVSAEEQAFFAELLRKDGQDPTAEAVQQYAAEINATFYLGSRMDLCEPFTYETLRYRTEAENNDRAMKKLTGQLYYGPDAFSEVGYFEYRYSRLHSDMITWLADRRDDAMTQAARDFYDTHQEQFTGVKSVTYQITEDGVTKTKTMDNTLFRTMGQSDPALMDCLERSEIGEKTELTDGTGRVVEKLEMETELLPFAEQERYVVEIWLAQEVLDALIGAVAANTTLVF